MYIYIHTLALKVAEQEAALGRRAWHRFSRGVPRRHGRHAGRGLVVVLGTDGGEVWGEGEDEGEGEDGGEGEGEGGGAWGTVVPTANNVS